MMIHLIIIDAHGGVSFWVNFDPLPSWYLLLGDLDIIFNDIRRGGAGAYANT